MATAPLLVRRATAVLAAACALFAAPAVASAAPPLNDVASTPTQIAPSSLLGVRNAVYEAERGGPIFGVDMTDATPSPDDPVLKNDLESSSCNAIPTQGTDTVFYRLTGVDERTAITIDTHNSTYQTAIAIFEGSISQAGLIHCERGNLANGAASVDFVTEAGKVYFVEVASVTGSGLLNLYMRAQDLQPPTIAVSAPSVLAEPNGLSTFRLAEDPVDNGAGTAPITQRPYQWTARFLPDGAAQPVDVPVTVATDNESITVRWPDDTNWAAGLGTATVRVWDNAGNMATARLTLRVRDRQAPKVVRPKVVPVDARRRITLRAACSETGRLHMQLRNQTRGRRYSRAITIPIKRANVARSATWRNVRPDVYLAQWTCFDERGNKTIFIDNFLFGF